MGELDFLVMKLICERLRAAFGQVRGEYSYYCTLSYRSNETRLHIKRVKGCSYFDVGDYFGFVDVGGGNVEAGCLASMDCWSESAEIWGFSCSDPCLVDRVVEFFIDRVVS